MANSNPSVLWLYRSFNGAKSWQLGWFDDKSVSFTPGENGFGYEWEGIVRSTTGYKTFDDPVIIQLHQSDKKAQFYVSFNHVNGKNMHTGEAWNQVVVHEAVEGSYSRLYASLAVGMSYDIEEWNGKKADVMTVKVNFIYSDGSASISIKLHGPANPEFCPDLASKCDCIYKFPNYAALYPDRAHLWQWPNEIQYANCVRSALINSGCDVDETIERVGCIPFSAPVPSCNDVASECDCVERLPGYTGYPWLNEVQYVSCIKTKIRSAGKYCPDMNSVVTSNGCLPLSSSDSTLRCEDIANAKCDCVERIKGYTGYPWRSPEEYKSCVERAFTASGKYCDFESTTLKTGCIETEAPSMSPSVIESEVPTNTPSRSTPPSMSSLRGQSNMNY